MKLFSKRNIKNKISEIDFIRMNKRYPVSYRKRQNNELIEVQLRTRLISLIKFLALSESFLEKYILVDNKQENIHYFNKELLDNFSESELGYKFSYFFDFYPFVFKGKKIKDNEAETVYEFFDDFVLFDLLETVILFSKKECRNDVILRIDKILKEENADYCINKNIITRDDGENLENIATQLKDEKLNIKITAYYDFYSKGDYVNAAKISADVVNIISSDGKADKKKILEKLKKDLTDHIVSNKKETTNRKKEFLDLITDISKLCQTLNNKIFDIRHTEKDRIKISNEYLYKMVCNYNISFVELILTSLKDDYTFIEDWENIKEENISNYQINKDTHYYIPSSEDEIPTIDLDDVPF